MIKKIDNKRVGFHSIESIIKNNPHKIKKLFIPQSREDKRIVNLIALAEKNGIKYQVSKKLKQEPEAEILNEVLQPVHHAMFVESNPSPVKYAAKLLGLCNDSVRLPLVEVTDSNKEIIKKTLQSAKLI